MTEDNPGLLASIREEENGSKRLDLENIDGTLEVLMLCYIVGGVKPRVLNRRLLCFFCVLFQNQNYY